MTTSSSAATTDEPRPAIPASHLEGSAPPNSLRRWRHIPEMDGVRGIAILLVMVFHIAETNHIYAATGAITRPLLATILYGWAGVDLFFVLSGFLITGILLNARTSPHRFENFYMRRVLRIFPLYYAVLVLLFVVAPFVPRLYTEGIQTARQHQWWYWSYLTNLPLSREHYDWIPWPTTHLWSLAVEEQFYLVWPTVVFFTPTNRRLFVTCLIGVGVSLAFRFWAILFSAVPLGAYFSTIARMDALLVGAAISVLFLGGGLTARRVQLARLSAIAAALLIIVLKVSESRLPGGQATFQIIGYLLNATVAGGLISVAATADQRSRLSGVLRTRVLAFFGRYSYALYIFHVLVIAALNQVYRLRPVDAGPVATELSWARLLTWSSIYFAITIAGAMVSWRLLESPFLRLKDRFAPRPSRVEARVEPSR